MLKSRLLGAVGIVAVVGGVLAAQTPSGPAFEVASVRQNISRSGPVSSIDLTLLTALASRSRNGLFRLEAVPLSLLIELAYNVKDFQLTGGPGWVSTDRYDINAKADGDVAFEQMRPMLRSLLADRFKLTVRQEARTLPVYELAAAKGGLKIAPTKEGSCKLPDPNRPPQPRAPGPPLPLDVCGGSRRQVVPDGLVRIDALAISIPKLIELLSSDVDRNVVDATGFTSLFDLHLEFTPSMAVGGDAGRASPFGDPGTSAVSGSLLTPSIFTAVQEQLGLKLESTKGPVDVLVIDHVERPSED